MCKFDPPVASARGVCRIRSSNHVEHYGGVCHITGKGTGRVERERQRNIAGRLGPCVGLSPTMPS